MEFYIQFSQDYRSLESQADTSNPWVKTLCWSGGMAQWLRVSARAEDLSSIPSTYIGGS